MASIPQGNQEGYIISQQRVTHSHDATGNCVRGLTPFKKDIEILNNNPERYTVYFSHCFCQSLPALALKKTLFANNPDFYFHPHPVYSQLALCSFPKSPESLTALQRLASKVALKVDQNVAMKITDLPAVRLEVVGHNQLQAVRDHVTLNFPAAENTLFLSSTTEHTEERARQLYRTLAEWAPRVVAGEEEKEHHGR